MNKTAATVTVNFYVKFLFIRIYFLSVPYPPYSRGCMGFVIGNYLSERKAGLACQRLNQAMGLS